MFKKKKKKKKKIKKKKKKRKEKLHNGIFRWNETSIKVI